MGTGIELGRPPGVVLGLKDPAGLVFGGPAGVEPPEFREGTGIFDLAVGGLVFPGALGPGI